MCTWCRWVQWWCESAVNPQLFKCHSCSTASTAEKKYDANHRSPTGVSFMWKTGFYGPTFLNFFMIAAPMPWPAFITQCGPLTLDQGWHKHMALILGPWQTSMIILDCYLVPLNLGTIFHSLSTSGSRQPTYRLGLKIWPSHSTPFREPISCYCSSSSIFVLYKQRPLRNLYSSWTPSFLLTRI